MENKEYVIQVDEEISLNIVDVESSETMKHMIEQVFNQDEYNIRKMNFEDGDVYDLDAFDGADPDDVDWSPEDEGG